MIGLQITLLLAFMLVVFVLTEPHDDDDEGGGKLQPVYVRPRQ